MPETHQPSAGSFVTEAAQLVTISGRRSAGRYRLGVDAIGKRVLAALGCDPTQGLVMLNRHGTPIWASDSIFSLVDFDPDAADPLLDALHPDDAELCAEIFDVERAGVADTTFEMDRRFELIVRIRSPRGGWRPVALRLLNYVDNPNVDGMLLQLTLANQEHSTVEAFDAAALGDPLHEVIGRVLETLCSGGSADAQAAMFDGDDRCIAATSGAAIALGEPRTGASWLGVVEDRLDLSISVLAPLSGAHLGILESYSNFPDVRPFTRLLTGRVARRIGLLIEAEHTREELRRQAEGDVLTGLANRRALLAHLSRTDLGDWVSVAFVDLNGFKDINDRYGHDVGDEVLVEVARRLRDVARGHDLIARIGGDEFVLVRQGDSPESSAIRPMEVERAVNTPLAVGEILLDVVASVGIASGPANETETLIARADAAMYSFKGDRQARRQR